MKTDQQQVSQLMAHLEDEYQSLEKYRYQASIVNNPVIKKKLEKLVDIEREHVRLLERVLGLHMEVRVNSEKPPLQERRDLHELLAQDYEDEKAAYYRYRQQSLETSDPELKQILERMAQDELGHMDLIKEMYRTLS